LRAIFCLPTTDDDGNAAAAAKPMHHPANIEGREIYEGMSTEAKDFIRTHEHAMVKLHAERGDLAGYIAKQEFDDETKLALWNVLPSNVRTAIKKQQADARRPSPAEQA
jgi:predicted NodU family carbamoyl transferase